MPFMPELVAGIQMPVRNFFEKQHMGEYFTHVLGHGTGLQIHEEPVLAPRAQGTLKENMIVT